MAPIEIGQLTMSPNVYTVGRIPDPWSREYMENMEIDYCERFDLNATWYFVELLSTACRRQCRDNREFSTVDTLSLLCRQISKV